MTNNIVETIKERLSINQVLGFYLKGRKDIKGNHKYKCPFHGDGNERTPSLNASDQRGYFKCFGCQKSGDIISFVREYDKNNQLSFFEALEQLKDDFPDSLGDVNITMGGTVNDKDYEYKKTIYELHEEVNVKMEEYLFSEEGRLLLQYLKEKRKLTEETIKKFRLGVSNSRSIEDFVKNLIKTNPKYSKIKIQDTGLFGTSSNSGDIYFIFTDRIMFPVFNNRKKIIGWSGGRIYDEQEPKYIHSTNNFIYNKSTSLYNIDKVNFQSNNSLYICEGNLDSIQLYNYGSDNAVSMLGTNLTDTQIISFKNKIKQVVLLLDTDEAGGKAMIKISQAMLSLGIIPYMVNIGQSKDIDDFLKSKPELKGNIKEYIEKNKKDILKDYLIQGYVLNQERMTIEHRYEVLKVVYDMYSKIEDDIIRNIYKYELGKHNIEFENLEKEYELNKKVIEKEIEEADKSITTKKWSSEIYILYAIYLIQNELLSMDDINARNFELSMLLNSSSVYKKYINNIQGLQQDYPGEIIMFDEIKDKKIDDLFKL